jgi:hypothetical protein
LGFCDVHNLAAGREKDEIIMRIPQRSAANRIKMLPRTTMGILIV